MTVRREIAEPRMRDRWPKARRSSGSAIVAETFMNNVGQEQLDQRDAEQQGNSRAPTRKAEKARVDCASAG